MASAPNIVKAGTPNDGLGPGWEPIEEGPRVTGGVTPPSAPGAGPRSSSPYFAASIPQQMQLPTDIVKTNYPGGLGGYRVMPPAPAGIPSLVAATTSITQPAIDNLQGQITQLQNQPAPESVTDGLTHGTDPWESDPGYIILRDDFHAGMNSNNISGTAPTTGIGQLGWALLGSVGSRGGMLGGQAPNLGQFAWSNNGTASDAGWLTLCGSGGMSNSDYSQLGWALFDNPGWVMSFVFKVDTGDPVSSSPKFSMAQTSIYVGLVGQNLGNLATAPISRPNIFIGVRYDTSTTSPSIDDSFFTLEVVVNPQLAPPARNNTQGTTLVTATAPLQGEWHRLDIECNAAGMVTLTLDGADTLTTAVPQYAITANFGTLQQNGQGRLNWTPTGSVPYSGWTDGSVVTFSGFTSSLASLNGPHTLNGSSDSQIGFLFATSLGGSETATATGFPSLIPVFMAGQDDTASPDFNDWLFCVDYFTFIWNPNLGPAAPGTPDATKSRYF